MIYSGLNTLYGQKIYIGDSCFNHYVQYTLISNHPTQYLVKEYQGAHLLFEGKCERVYSGKGYLNSIASYINHSNYFFRDTAILYEPNGVILRKTIAIEQFMHLKDWKYKDGKLIEYSRVEGKGRILVDRFQNGDTILKSTLDKKGTVHMLGFRNGEVVMRSTRNNRHQMEWFENGVLISSRLGSGSSTVYKKYKNGKLFRVEYYKKGKIIQIIQIDSAGNRNVFDLAHKGWINNLFQYNRQKIYYNKKEDVYYRFLSDGSVYNVIKEYEKKVIVTDFYKNRKRKNEITYLKKDLKKPMPYNYQESEYYRSARFWYLPIDAKDFSKKGELIGWSYHDGNRESVDHKKYLNGYLVYSTSYRKGEGYFAYYNDNSKGIIQRKNGVFYIRDTSNYNEDETIECWVDKKQNYFIKTKKEEKVWAGNLLLYHGELTGSDTLSYGTFTKVYDKMRNWFFDTTQMHKSKVRDTLFVNTIVHQIYINGFLAKQRFSGKRFQLSELRKEKAALFKKREGNHIAKDVTNCTVGVKAQDDTWLINPVFDHITKQYFLGDSLYIYYASSGTWGTVYDNNGKVLIPATQGLTEKRIQFSEDFCIERQLVSNLGFIVNNRSMDSFYVKTYHNQLILKGRGYLEGYPLNVHGFYSSKGYYKIRDGRSNGLLTKEGNYIEPLYSRVRIEDNRVFLHEMPYSGLFQVADLKGKLLSARKFSRFNSGSPFIGSKCWAIFSDDNELLIDSSGSKIDAYEYQKSRALMVSKKDKKGVLSEDLSILLPTDFDSIHIFRYCYIAHKADSTFMFDESGKLILAARKYNVVTKRIKGVAPKFNHYYFAIQSLIVERGNKYGLLDSRGFFIAKIEYEDIGFTGYHTGLSSYDFEAWNSPENEIVLVKDKKAVIYEIRDSVILAKHKSEGTWFYQSYLNGKTHLLHKSGEIKISNIKREYADLDYKDRPFLNKYFIYKDTIGLPFLGVYAGFDEWILKFNTYAESKKVGNYYYVKTKEGKSGVIDCSGQTIIEPTYRYIYYDHTNELLWFRDSQYIRSDSFKLIDHRHSSGNIKNQDYWKVKSLKSGVINSSKFDYPVGFKFMVDYTPFSEKGKIGLMGKDGKIYAPAIYEALYFLEKRGVFIFKIRGKIFVWNAVTKKMEPQVYERFTQAFGTKIYAYNRNKIYLLGNNYLAIDSTDNFYANQPQKMQHWFDSNYFGAQYLRNVDLQLMGNMQRMLKVAKNREDFVRKSFCYPNYKMADGFPFKTYKNLPFPMARNNYYPQRTQLETSINFLAADIFTNYYKNRSQSRNTITFYKGYGAGYINLLLDTVAGIVRFNLEDLVDEQQLDSFKSLLQNAWQKLENPTMPCININRLMEYFNRSFAIQPKEFVFYANSKPFLTIPKEEILPLLKPFWQGKLKN